MNQYDFEEMSIKQLVSALEGMGYTSSTSEKPGESQFVKDLRRALRCKVIAAMDLYRSCPVFPADADWDNYIDSKD